MSAKISTTDLENASGETRSQQLFRIFDKDADKRVSSDDLLRTLASVFRMPSSRQDYQQAAEILGNGSPDKFQALLDHGKLLDTTTLQLCLELDSEQQDPNLSNDEKREQITQWQIFVRIFALNLFLPLTFWAKERFYAVGGVRFFAEIKVKTYSGLMAVMLVIHLLVWASVAANAVANPDPVEGGPTVGLGLMGVAAFSFLSAIVEMSSYAGKHRSIDQELLFMGRCLAFETIEVTDDRGVRETFTMKSLWKVVTPNFARETALAYINGSPTVYGDETEESKGRFAQRRLSVGVTETATQSKNTNAIVLAGSHSEDGGRTRKVRISLKIPASIMAWMSMQDFQRAIARDYIERFIDSFIRGMVIFFAAVLLYSMCALFSVIEGGAEDPTAATCILLTLILGGCILRIVSAAIKCSNESSARTLKTYKFIHSELELESMRTRENASMLEAVRLMEIMIGRCEAIDFQASLFGVKMNMAVAQKFAAAAFGGMVTVAFKLIQQK
ncbi:hypothetical protein TeGR_g1676 [Tetraparma gracilis]|uniref:EF-hand domain-containing protein n=1 Tax=Tetraparma gracilis TaxID=2962635 RepID=A0ABQ6MNS2_9STRA|nr:hypothetical protein TeGR_g1676 [Tetraparma gracilis]